MGLFTGHRQWIYTKSIKGTFQHVHRISGIVFIAIMFIVPWLSYAGHPLVRFDVPARRLYLVGLIFTASDGFLIVLSALLAAFLLFFVSALFGRMWCGYACPQTVFLEEWVRQIELYVEGDAKKRRKLDEGPWNFNKVWRKTLKVSLLVLLAMAVGGITMGYFAGPVEVFTGQASSMIYFIGGTIAVAFLVDWLWFREQFCIYVCPYARFQSTLTDADSLMVGFKSDIVIGKGKAAAKAGQCIDCFKCVDVCPQGIDIRDGFQLECIQCARCIDACETVMPKLGFPTHIHYTTINKEEGIKSSAFIRPRTVIYAALISGLSFALLFNIVMHNPIEVTLHRSPGSFYQVDDDGYVRNTYMLRVVNNDGQDQQAFAVGITGVEGLQVQIPPIILKSGEDRTIPVVLRVPVDNVDDSIDLTFTIRSQTSEQVLIATFLGPAK